MLGLNFTSENYSLKYRDFLKRGREVKLKIEKNIYISLSPDDQADGKSRIL